MVQPFYAWTSSPEIWIGENSAVFPNLNSIAYAGAAKVQLQDESEGMDCMLE